MLERLSECEANMGNIDRSGHIDMVDLIIELEVGDGSLARDDEGEGQRHFLNIDLKYRLYVIISIY